MTLTVPAQIEQLDAVLNFVEEQLAPYDVSARIMIQLMVAVEELFVNIAHYAYPPSTVGEAAIDCRFDAADQRVVITFSDRGRPYDPLAKPDPDLTLPAEERPIGGLGIFMVKKSMDQVAYRYENGRNILTITKSVSG